MTLKSMTGFSRSAGTTSPYQWAWELKTVNAKGLDVAQISSVVNTTSSARLSGSLDLQSKWQGVETGAVSGEGDAQLSDGKLQGVAILNQLAGVLRRRVSSRSSLVAHPSRDRNHSSAIVPSWNRNA